MDIDLGGFARSKGWVPIFGPGPVKPDEKAFCQVLDAKNWTCTASDRYGVTSTQMIGGRRHAFMTGDFSPEERLAAEFEKLARCDVQTDDAAPQPLQFAHQLDVGKPFSAWIDCRNPLP